MFLLILASVLGQTAASAPTLHEANLDMLRHFKKFHTSFEFFFETHPEVSSSLENFYTSFETYFVLLDTLGSVDQQPSPAQPSPAQPSPMQSPMQAVKRQVLSDEKKYGIFFEGIGQVHFQNSQLGEDDYGNLVIQSSGDYFVIDVSNTTATGAFTGASVATDSGVDLDNLDSEVVKTTGDQTVAGAKTFSDSVSCPSLTIVGSEAALESTGTVGQLVVQNGSLYFNDGSLWLRIAFEGALGCVDDFTTPNGNDGGASTLSGNTYEFSCISGSAPTGVATCTHGTWDSVAVCAAAMIDFTMSSNTDSDPSGFIASSSSHLSDTFLPFYGWDDNGGAFVSVDSKYATADGYYVGTEVALSSDGNAGEWLMLEMPETYLVTGYTMYPRTTHGLPTVWTILMSSDGVDWTVVGSEDLGFIDPEVVTYYLDEPAEGSYVAMQVYRQGHNTGGHSASSYLNIQEIRLF